ncbi:MAG: hypothetical protein DIU68_011325 [Chloroflexota bacterium]|nr:MAG: hypothetical protein DIU68_07230 [Chloroflexota bacterium]
MQPPATRSAGSRQTCESCFTVDWLADNRILCLRFANTSRAAVDRAAADLKRELDCVPEGASFYLLLDLRQPNAVITPFGLRRIREIARYRPDVQLRLAVVTMDQLSLEIAKLSGRGTCLGDHCSHYVGVQEAQAVAWLLSGDTIALSSS